MEINQMLFFQFLLAGLLGAFIGLERGLPRNYQPVEKENSFGGLRSYSLISLLGAISVFLDKNFGIFFFSFFSLFIIATYIGIAYIYTTFKKDSIGLTTEYSAIMAYFMGVLVMQGSYSIALVLTIILTIILSSKEFLEKFSSSISRKELTNTLKFAVVAFVILPLLPDEKYSFATLFSNLGLEEALLWKNAIWQMAFFNPYSLWFFVVVMSGVGYVGYVLSKFFGHQSSVLLSSVLGGLVSSTAVTATMSEQSLKDKENYHIYIVGTLLANCIMFLRVILIVLLFDIALLGKLFIPATLMFVGLVSATFYFYYTSRTLFKAKKVDLEGKMESPFRIIPALKFGGFVLFIKFIAALGLLYKDIWGEKFFYYVLGIISGLADVDAITQTMATQSHEGLVIGGIAVSTILLAVMSNNTVKSSIAYKFGEKRFGKGVVFSFLISTILGIIGIVVVNM